ncbi:methyltransferase, FkbM family protein [Kordia algicida OT-1]|uniref:Methyltransferase, FkbM family protein n=1 Tax=Kordia algicida OT-1 TaxID=391587 RepID=A9DP55_9FLAO|nr:FkbM family methyltransferase [Kordia algicida]EDP97358.1 methyltransferase, FkbM family protein [Kordia algicida OT-1]
MQVQLKNHTFQIDPGQNKHYWSYINSIDWEPHTFAIFDHFINEDSVVLDIGSWSGVLTLYAAKTAKEVHALDPDPVCFSELNRNVQLNPAVADKIKTYKTAISAQKETVRLSARETYGASSSSILERKRDAENSLELETISLADFLEKENIQKVDFIKMDVEGAEFKILPTIGKAIEKINYPTLYISFHYSFLNENIYHKNIPSVFLNKLFMRLENTFGFSRYKSKIRKEIANLYDDLKAYTYIYKSDGTPISFEDLAKKPELIKETDLVFTNVEWRASTPLSVPK